MDVWIINMGEIFCFFKKTCLNDVISKQHIKLNNQKKHLNICKFIIINTNCETYPKIEKKE